MKRGLEEASAKTPSLKKAKTINNGEGSIELRKPVVQVDDSGEQWIKVEKKKKKKISKAESKMDKANPRFMYSNTEIVKRHHAITIDDIRDLILHLLADAPPPNWLRIDNVRMIQKVVALLIPGITPEVLSLPPFPTSATSNPNLPVSIPLLPPQLDGAAAGSAAASIPFIASTFSHACPTRAPGDQTRMHSVLSSFFTGPISGEEKKRRLTQKQSESIIKDDPTRYLLTLEQMIENDYPIPSYMADVFEKPPGWLETPEPNATESKWGPPKVYAIDCEMCITEDGKELTRVCVIDFASGIVVFDQLVKPSKPILDYLTRWSGITEEALATVTTTLSQVQANILRLLSPPPPIKPNPFSSPSSSKSQTLPPPQAPTPILLGHSLESDLKALKICHPRCIDTALMYHHPRGRPLKPGLKWLTEKWCGRKIQTRGEGGHDPEEDARACLDLLKKKLEEGPGFGEFKTDYESIFERMGRATWRGGGGVDGGIKTAVVDLGNPGVMHGNKADTALGCKTDDEVLEGLLNVIPSHQFTFGRFMALANILGWVTPKVTPDSLLVQTQSSPTTPAQNSSPEPTPAILGPILSNLNTHLKTLQESLPSRTALIIFTGHSDPRRMSALNQRKSAFDTAYKSGKTPEELAQDGVTWTASEGRELEEQVELARRGLLFLGVKQ